METHKTSLIILLLIFIFAVIHSGGAALRIKAESIMGPRLWRLCFVFLSLPSAIILISYFLAHRYDESDYGIYRPIILFLWSFGS